MQEKKKKKKLVKHYRLFHISSSRVIYTNDDQTKKITRAYTRGEKNKTKHFKEKKEKK